MPRSHISTSSDYTSNRAEDDMFYLECEASYLSVLPSTNTPIDSRKQLRKALQQAGRNPSEKQINDIWGADTDVITYKEYCDLLRKSNPPSRDDLLSAFKKIDLNGDGFISHSELYKVLTSQGEKMTVSEVKKIINDADVNRDGKLDYAEFCTLMLSTSQRCQQNNFKHLKGLKAEKKGSSSIRPTSGSSHVISRPTSASSHKSTIGTPRPMQRTTYADVLEEEQPSSSRRGSKSGSRPTSAKKSSIPDEKLVNSVKIKQSTLAGKKSNSVAPKMVKTWNHVKSRGCFYLDNDDGSLLCHHYLLELPTASKVWLTIKPHYISQTQDLPPNPIDTCMLILKQSSSQSERSEFIGVTNLRENAQYCWKGDLRSGSYVLVPFTSGCRLFRRRKEPEEEIQLIRRDQNNDVQLSRAFRETLSDMFEMCDLDGNGLLNREEFNWFQLLTSEEEVDDEAWQIVQENFEMKKGELTREGFVELHLMQAKEENVDAADELLDTVQCMGYNKALDLDQACPFEVYAYTADCKAEMSVSSLSLGHQYADTERMIVESVKQVGEKQKLKDMPGIEWYVYNDEMRVSSVLENQSRSTIEIDVDCTRMKNCATTKRKENYALRLVPNSSMLVDHVMAEDERREWLFHCAVATHDPTGSSTHSLKSSSSRPRSASKKSSLSLF